MVRRSSPARSRLVGRRAPFDWRNPMSWIRLTALRRGVLGGSGGWMVVAVLVWLPRLIARIAARRDELVASESLRPGESISIGTSVPRRRGGAKVGRRS